MSGLSDQAVSEVSVYMKPESAHGAGGGDDGFEERDYGSENDDADSEVFERERMAKHPEIGIEISDVPLKINVTAFNEDSSGENDG